MPYFYFEGGGEVGETILQNKISSTLPRSAFDKSFCLVTGHEYPQRHPNGTGVKDLPMCPLCGSAEEMGPDRTQSCQSVTDDMNNAKKRDKLRNVSKLCWTARQKMGGDAYLSGVGKKKIGFELLFWVLFSRSKLYFCTYIIVSPV